MAPLGVAAVLMGVVAATPPVVESSDSDALIKLKLALQTEVLDWLSLRHPTFALQLGWTSADGTSFGLAAGKDLDGRKITPEDKFLFGSGTKPVTATAVLRLADEGKLSLEDPVAQHVDPLLRSANGTSLVALFGKAAANVTVGQLLAMQSGLPDFDTPQLDDAILRSNGTDWPPYAILREAAKNGAMHFEPGRHTEYSSTNYVLAGLVLLAHSPSATGDWRKLDLFDLAFPPALRPKYEKLGVSFINDEPISSKATVRGVSGMIRGKHTPIWHQRGGILGWTCGNMAASAHAVSGFYHDLLVKRALVSPSSVRLMERFHVLDVGWARGNIRYGSGLMVEQSTYRHVSIPPVFSQWGAYMGHGGDTYGFLSEQGIIGNLGNASFSVVSNQDYDGMFVTTAVACRTINVAAKVLLGKDVGLQCYS